MAGEDRFGERLDHRRQPIGHGLGRGLDGGAWPPFGQRDGLAGEDHRRQRLANRVEHPEQQALPRDRPRDQAGGAHRIGEHLAAGAREQRPIEVEEGRAA
jgi:hypothetical protein